jgi:hypothetical protein
MLDYLKKGANTPNVIDAGGSHYDDVQPALVREYHRHGQVQTRASAGRRARYTPATRLSFGSLEGHHEPAFLSVLDKTARPREIPSARQKRGWPRRRSGSRIGGSCRKDRARAQSR